jgi:adenosylmethionine-8-amino-7-oxononanoate aminotransferase
MVYPMGGTVDGLNGDHVLIAPPFIFDDTHCEELLDKLEITLNRVLTPDVIAG